MIHGIQYRYILIWLAMCSAVGLNMIDDLLNCNAVSLNVQGFDHMNDRLTLDDSMPLFDLLAPINCRHIRLQMRTELIFHSVQDCTAILHGIK